MDKRMAWLLIVGLVLAAMVVTWPGESTDLKDILVMVMSVAQFALIADMKKKPHTEWLGKYSGDEGSGRIWEVTVIGLILLRFSKEVMEMDKRMAWLLIVGLMLAIVVATWPGESGDLKDAIGVIMSVAQFALIVDMKKDQALGGHPELDRKEM